MSDWDNVQAASRLMRESAVKWVDKDTFNRLFNTPTTNDETKELCELFLASMENPKDE